MSFESPQQYNTEEDKQSGEVFDTKDVGNGIFEVVTPPNLTASIPNSLRDYFLARVDELAKVFDVKLTIDEKPGALGSIFEIRVDGDRENVLNFEKNMRDFGR